MFRRSRCGAARSRRARSNHSTSSQRIYRRKPVFELLEDRRMLAVLTVNSALDNVTPGDGLVTLREAIVAANNDTATDLGQTGSGIDHIKFAATLSGATIQLSNLGELKITSPMLVDAFDLANGITIKAFDTTVGNGDGTRIFNIDDGNAAAIDVSLDDLTLTGGDVVGGGGAILSRENLTLDTVTITANRATLDGGAIDQIGAALTIADSTFSGNTAVRDGGGIYQSGGTMDITDSTVSGNSGRLGGGINATGGIANFTYGTISGNNADTGGGLLSSGAKTTISSSTISGNSANNLGGGIWANVTAGNSLTILYSTITRNSSDKDVNGSGAGGGIYFGPATGTATVKNTIIAGNTDFSNRAPDIDNTSAATHPTLNQTFTLVGNNKGSGLPAGGLIGTPIAPINPLLGSLTNNGGPTKTHALLPGSPAINSGSAGATPPSFDQRGTPFARIVGAALDIGAFEAVAPLTQSTMALLASSDTGMFNNDHVTNKMQPAFGGVGLALSTVLVYAQATDSTGAPSGEPFVIGTGTVGSDPTAGTTTDGFGAWEVTVEPLADGKYLFFARFDTTVVPIEGPLFHVLSVPVGNAPQTLTSTDFPLKTIPAGPNGVAVSQINVQGGGGGAGFSIETKYVASLTVTVNITYPHAGDLTLYLIGPDGASVLLSNQNGGNNPNYTNTVFDDSSTLPITAGVPPFTGTFRPEQPLSAFVGELVNGPWTLEVVNNVAGNTGTIGTWSLAIESEIGVVIDTVAPNTPFLDLISDSGRNNADNVTKFNQPSVSMTSSDPNGQFAQLLFTDNLKFRIYDRFVSPGGNAGAEVLIYDSAQDPDADAISNALDMFTSATQLTKIMPFLKPSSPGITTDGKLADGVHNFKLVVEDRAGNISHDFQQTITVDTTSPPASFGLPTATSATDGLIAASDSGVTTLPATYADRITNVSTPTFWGRAEANSIVNLYYDKNADGLIQESGPNADIFLGQTVAVPFDGNDAFPNGYWQITSALDLNQITGVPKDGLRRLLMTAEDVAGNPTPSFATDFPILPPTDQLQIFIDTQGPQVTAVTPNNSNFNLFSLKPAQTGPTPLVNSLKIAFKDLPSRADSTDPNNKFLYDALVSGIAQTAGNYVLVGDHVGTIAIQSITVTNTTNQITGVTLTGAQTTTVLTAAGLIGATTQPEVGDYILISTGAAAGQVRRITAYNSATGVMTLDVALINTPAAGDTLTITKAATATVTLTFASPLPDDRYTLTIKDSLVDPAGNKLDGESHQIEPQGPVFPSGDGVPGGNFVARFTVDSHPEIGNYVSQNINIDINGNFVWDPANAQIGGDSTNVDLSFTLQVQTAAGATAPGGFNVHDLLFAGKFLRPAVENGAALSTHFDQLAAFGNAADLAGAPFRWLIDTNSDGVITTGTDILNLQPTLANFNISGAIPVAGNFDGNAANGDEIGLYNAGKWALDTNHNFVIDSGDTFINSSLFGAPIVGDFDGDGKVDLAVFNNNVFSFDLANNGLSGGVDATVTWGFPGVLDKPVAADMDGDGITDIGLWVPRTDATNPYGVAQWYFLISNDFTTPGVAAPHTAGSIAKINHAFSPTPLGHDIFAEFGDERSLPIVGNFDPPLSAASVASLGKSMGDFDGSGKVDQADYNIWRSTFGSTTNLAADANRDGIVDSADFSMWRDHMGQSVPGAGGGAGGGLAALSADSAVGSEAVAQKAVVLSATAPITSGSAAVAPAASSLVMSPTASSTSPAASTATETATAPSTAEHVDRALLLLLDETPAAIPAPSESSLAAASDGQSQEDDAATTDSEALAVVWQSWGSL
jgi:subtilisin-like proprotein convertase family protein